MSEPTLTMGSLRRAIDRITPLKMVANPADAKDALFVDMVANGFKLRESEHISQRTVHFSTPDQFGFLNLDTKVATLVDVPDWMKP